MPVKSAIAELERNVERYYQKYSAMRVAMATLSVGIVTVLVALVAYSLSQSSFIALSAFAIVGLITINLAMYAIVPPSERLLESRRFLIDALKDPSRIREAGVKRVKLLDEQGKLRALSGFEQRVWQSLVVPFYIRMSTKGGGEVRKEPSVGAHRSHLTTEERKEMALQRAELTVMERKMQKEREKLEHDRTELEQRSAELKDAENLVIERLNSVERAEAEIEQMREDVKSLETVHDVSALNSKEQALHTKEAELERLRLQLAEDRKAVEAQKAEIGRIETRTPFTHENLSKAQTDEERERLLTVRVRELEDTARELEERSRYVDEVEDSLIARLNELSEREASIEQGEVKTGVRED